MSSIVINAITFPQDGMWVVQCLEYNFVSCARTREELAGTLMSQIVAQIEADLEAGHEPFFEFQPAPAKYWKLFEKARRQAEPIRQEFVSLQHERVETKLFPIAA